MKIVLFEESSSIQQYSIELSSVDELLSYCSKMINRFNDERDEYFTKFEELDPVSEEELNEVECTSEFQEYFDLKDEVRWVKERLDYYKFVLSQHIIFTNPTKIYYLFEKIANCKAKYSFM